ncbi:MAG: alpha-2-macroglobulin family protein [Aridibacter sp.]
MRNGVIALLVVCFLCAFSANAQIINESESSIILNEKTADVFFMIENSNRSFTKKLTLELLDNENKILTKIVENVKIETGKKEYKFSLPLGDLMKNGEKNDIIWHRLRYSLDGKTNIVSLSELVKDNFELRVIATNNLLPGMNYRSRIRAVNPLNNQPIEKVFVSAELNLELKDGDKKELILNSSGITDADGFAVLDFKIPVETNFDGDGELKISGKKYGLVREATEDLSTVSDDFSFLMMTDKPIYQPEQELKIRGILLKGVNEKTVISNTAVDFKIEDEDDTLLYRETVKTSAFGIAAISWKIPENAKLGTYKVRVKSGDGDYFGYQNVKVSRYDLPNFAVIPKSDKSFYLPNEKTAEVTVRADYLFGKPVTRGKIRIVQENSREWNWEEQKYEIDEGQVREGETDADGKFTAKFDLSEAHKDLKDNDWRKFEDLNFTAYFTDLTTNKTEQRRFDIRISKEPIHVYFIGGRYDLNPNLPVNAYVSTFYADGTPAVCDVELKGREDDTDGEFKTIKRIETNSFGAGKLEFMRPVFEEPEVGDDLEIRLIAVDKKGQKGTFGFEDNYLNELQFDGDDSLQIQTEKTIYKSGESVKLEIKSSLKTGLVYIDVVKNWSVIDSYFVELANGKAELKIPYDENFQGDLTVAAFLEDKDDDVVRTSRGIIFPTPQNLQLDAKFDKATYKPAEEAKVNFSVLDTIGSAVESALGVVVFDKAVEERAKTDAEFGGMFGNFYGWLGYGESFGGINVKDLNELDLTKPISDELQLVAEILLHDKYYYPNIFHSRNYELDAKSVYAEFFKKQLAPFEKVLNETYKNKNFKHSTDENSLKKILAEKGLNLDNLHDPWGQKYRAVFDVEKTQDILKIETSGADKKFGTDDDFAVSSLSFTYFTPTGKAIDEAVENYHKRTGGFIRDEKTFLRELGISELKDRFGRPYRLFFEIEKRFYSIRIHSLGKDGIYEQNSWRGDDFDVWTNRIDYFADTELKIANALQKVEKTPLNENDFIKLLSEKGIEFEQIKDGYGQNLYLKVRQFSRYTDKAEIENVGKFGEKETTQRTKITPVTQEVIQFTLESKGADGRKFSTNDFTLAQFLFVLSEQTKDDEKPKKANGNIVYKNGTGAVSGKVTDPTGAVVPGVAVTGTNEESEQSKTVTSNDSGEYLIQNLAAGNYTLKAVANGFKSFVRTNVPIKANSTIKVDFTLQVGDVSSTVDVTVSADSVVETTNASIKTVTEDKPTNNFIPEIDVQNTQRSTPRLREYFPETLVWSPEIITNKNGKAELKFKMADNITTWKLYTIASTKNGKIGVAEKEVQAFQPFFVDLEPPKFLTVGDEIYLPTQVRNYTEQKQKVGVTMARSDWFSFLETSEKQLEVASGETENAVFGFRADKFIKGGKQKVTAIAETNSDAIEKPVTVRPNGREIVAAESKLFRQNAIFTVDFPANALPNTPNAELKIYPNLLAHIAESVEGLLQRPYGCGEQTISSTYPNLMILKFTPKENKLRQTAQKFLQKGYERLLGYQVSNGGFSYWGSKDEADIALTAYAIRFLKDADGFIEVDETIIGRAEEWLLKQQRADGTWTKKYSWEKIEDRSRTKLLTSYIARTLAMTKNENNDALQKALNYLKTKNTEIDEPYALALFGLASLENGNTEDAEIIAEKLKMLAIPEGDSVYWNLETNTPFYGWGKAGRIETTALVLQLLMRVSSPKSKVQSPKSEDLISRGTQFLLKNKDRYGVWYSTQTTINVLDTFLTAFADDKKIDNSTQRIAEIFINGEKVKTFNLPPLDELANPINLDLKAFLTSRNNRVEIKTNDDSSVMSQIVAEHYIAWKDAEISNRDTNESRQIRLDYKCDKLNAEIMQNVTCDVKAERIGFKGYGMLLAEIGIPPGADVSRESLENALKNDWSFSRYDVLPDRIIVYMWAKPGGTNFRFKFKPRYAINANTPASQVYDYYNAEAKATIAPMRFQVRSEK